MLSRFSFESLYWLCLFVLLIVMAYFSVGHFFGDEHYQILEFANWKLGNPHVTLAWEFDAKIRPAIQPTLVVLLHRLWNFIFGEVDPFRLTFLLRLFSAGIFIISIYTMIYSTRNWILPANRKTYLLLTGFFWFIPYLHVRFSSESWSSSTMVLALALVIFPRPFLLKHFLIGVLFGFAFLFRYQMGIMIAGFFGWSLLKLRRKQDLLDLGYLALGLLLILGLGIYIDYWFYGDWWITAYRYFSFNILEDGASRFGMEPVWFYPVQSLFFLLPPFSLVFLILFFGYGYFFPRSVLTWTVFPFVLIHFFIPHKEIRFFFPVTLFLPVMVVCSWQKLAQKFSWAAGRWKKRFLIAWFILNLPALTLVTLRPADIHTQLMDKIYHFEGPTLLFLTMAADGSDSFFVRGGWTGNFYLYQRDDYQTVEVNPNQDFRTQLKNKMANSLEVEGFTTKLLLTFQPVEEKLNSKIRLSGKSKRLDGDKSQTVLTPIPTSLRFKLVHRTPHPILTKLDFTGLLPKIRVRERYLYQIEGL